MIEYITPFVVLDRTMPANGQRAQGVYPGLDKYGRIKRQTWVDGAIAQHSSSGSLPSGTPYVEQTFTYDNNGNKLTSYDSRPYGSTTITSRPNKDFEYVYDGLNRLTEAKRGVRNGVNWTPAPSPSSGMLYAASQQWKLDFLGNHLSADSDLDADGTYESTVGGELIEGDHNFANELLERTVIASPNVELPFTYDKAGNMKEKAPGPGDDARYVYTYDAWNRLVKVEYKSTPLSTPVTRTELQYNAVHQITEKRSDSGDAPDGVLDQKRTRYYNAQWQLLLERIDDNYNSSSGVNRDMLYVWGIRGMDDICVRIQNRNFTNDSPNTTYDDFWYHLTDTQFSTIAIIDRVGKLLERISYTAGGEARHHHRADLNGDGGTSSGELFTISTLAASGGGVGTGITSSSYDPNADIDCDGTIDSADYGLVSSIGAQAALRRGQISGAWVAPSGFNPPTSTDNIVGYCGYLFNAECGLYSVRFRVYDPVLMRWLTRDPIGYVDGMNMYSYVRGNPMRSIDPFGLADEEIDPEVDGVVRGTIKKIIKEAIDTALKQVGKDELYTITEIWLVRVEGKFEAGVMLRAKDGKILYIRHATLDIEIEVLRAVGVTEDELNALRRTLKGLSKFLGLIEGLGKLVNTPENMEKLLDLLYQLLNEPNGLDQRATAIEIIRVLKEMLPGGRYEDLVEWLAIYGLILGDDWYKELVSDDLRKLLRPIIGDMRDRLRQLRSSCSISSSS